MSYIYRPTKDEIKIQINDEIKVENDYFSSYFLVMAKLQGDYEDLIPIKGKLYILCMRNIKRKRLRLVGDFNGSTGARK